MADPRSVDRLGLSAVIAVFAVCAILAYTTTIVPMRAKAAEARELKEAIGILMNAEGGLQGLRDEVKRVSEQIKAEETLLPSTIDLELFLANVERTASTCRVEIDALTPEEATDRPLIREQPVRLRAIGKFLDLYRFISTIEHSEPLTRVEQLSLLGAEEGDRCVADLYVVLFSSKAGG